MNSQLHLRRTPQLLFEYDQSVEHGVRMTKLIDDLDPGPEIPDVLQRRPMSQTTTDIAAVADALRAGERFLVTSHENPDGDALGSLLAMHLALVELGKDSVMVLAGAAPLPGRVCVPRPRRRTASCAMFPPTRASGSSSRSTARRRRG